MSTPMRCHSLIHLFMHSLCIRHLRDQDEQDRRLSEAGVKSGTEAQQEERRSLGRMVKA